MDEHIVMKVTQRRRGKPPGFTPRQRTLRELAGEGDSAPDWRDVRNEGDPQSGDIRLDGEAPADPGKKDYDMRDHLAPWYKQRAKDIENDSGDPLKRELELEEDGETDI